jgi:formate-nitrite transporter family protein
MSSDLATQGQPEAKKPYRQILREEIAEGVQALDRPPLGLLLSAVSGGLDVGFSLFVMAAMRTRAAGVLAEPVLDLLVASAYAVGFIFVNLGRSELFTEHTTLAVLPVLDRKGTIAGLARAWGLIYAGNLIGAAGFAALAVLIGPMLGIIRPEVFGEIARLVVSPSSQAILLSGVLAGWLMGLMSWLVTAARDTISQIALVWLIASVIGFARLHHAIVGSVEVLAGVFADQGVTLADYGRFLGWATLGNGLGGIFFVALLKYGHATISNESPQPGSTESSRDGSSDGARQQERRGLSL